MRIGSATVIPGRDRRENKSRIRPRCASEAEAAAIRAIRNSRNSVIVEGRAFGTRVSMSGAFERDEANENSSGICGNGQEWRAFVKSSISVTHRREPRQLSTRMPKRKPL
jgi:hypothetical protein